MSRVSPSLAHLDALEMVRTGALAAVPLGARPGTVTFPLGEDGAGARVGEEVEVTDLEGVPVARMPVVRLAGRVLASGVPVWLAPRSQRPFESWHRGPASLPARSGVVVLRGPASPDRVLAALDDAGSRPLLLLLVRLDGDVDPSALETAYVARDVLAARPDASVAVVPAPPSLSRAEQDAVVRSYAGDAPVTVVEPDRLARPSPGSGTVLLFTGLSGAGKSTLARAVRNRLVEGGRRVTLLDGDVVRRHLSAGLGFTAADRATNVLRIGWVAAEVAFHGGTAICSPIAPSEEVRQEVRRLVESRGGRCVVVHVATPLAECERRDTKGLYARARLGEISDFTGISSPYEEPAHPDLRLDTSQRDLEELVDDVLGLLEGSVRC